MSVKHYPAAFINNIADEGSKAEAIEWLQKTWNERCELAAENAALRAQLGEARAKLAEAAEDIEMWGGYASEYFQDKHDLAGCVASYRDMATPPTAEHSAAAEPATPARCKTCGDTKKINLYPADLPMPGDIVPCPDCQPTPEQSRCDHTERIVVHASGWREYMGTCVCGKAWPCPILQPTPDEGRGRK